MDTKLGKLACVANAIHYGLYKLFLSGHIRFHNLTGRYIPQRFKNRIQRNFEKAAPFTFFDNENGWLISFTHHNFGYLWSAYAGFFSFILMGIMARLSIRLSGIYEILILILPVAVGYLPIYLYVFKDDQYLKYFREFEKKGKDWQKKWKRVALWFMIGALPTLFLGIIIMDCIIKGK